MQPRANFELVKVDDPELFVVRISGHLGTRERRAVEDLVRKCRETGKHKVVFDFAKLESLGGGVAKVLGDFATAMATEGHPPWFIGASTVVQSFLTGRFDTIEPNFADDLEGAKAGLAAGPDVRAKAPSPPQVAARSESKPLPPVHDGMESLRAEDLLADVSADADEEPRASANPPDEPRARSGSTQPVQLPPAGTEPGVTRRHSYLTLADAEPLLVEVGTLREAKPILDGLLFGADLAESCEVFCLDGDRLVQVVSGAGVVPRWLPGNGSVSAVLRRRAAPVDIVDLTEMDLSDEESEVLTALNCSVVVPIFVDDGLEGVFFARKSQVGQDYISSEELALDLLARQVGLYLGKGRARITNVVPEAEKKLRGQLRRQRTVLRLCREFHSIDEEEQLISRLLISIIGEMGVSGAVYLVPGDRQLVAHHVYGIEDAEIRPLKVNSTAEVTQMREMVRVEQADPEVWGPAIGALTKLGIDVLMPLRGNSRSLGVLGLATRRARDAGNFDPEYLQSLIHQAGVAIEHVRSVHALEDQMLRMAKTLITLVEKRIGQGQLASTELVTYYTSRVAEHLSYDKNHRRDLLYGAVLRDVGMIEISDLVLKSPRSLTPEEWRFVKRHPITGAELLREMQFSDVTCDVVLHHHERFNGEGYPHGLRGTAIPQGARIVSVVESYVAMIRDMPYRPALSRDEALSVLEENWEMRYDPVVVETFVSIVRREPQPALTESVDALLVG